MRLWIFLRYFQFKESCQHMGLMKAIKKLVFRQRDIVLVVKALQKIDRIDNVNFKNLRLIEISPDNHTYGGLSYPIKSRKYKMLNYLKAGCNAFTVLDGQEVVGDVWYTTSKKPQNHVRDLNWLNIQLSKNEAYMFDMFVTPKKRGRYVTDFLVNRSLLALKEKGYKKVYGHYDTENVAALWFHRMHKYTELNKLTVKQFFLTNKVS